MGRPTKLSPKISEKIFEALRAGNNRKATAAYAGISLAAFQNWIAKGRSAKKGPYREFVDGLEKAEADAEVGAVAIIRKAAQTTWQAAAWWLERKFPKDWSRVQHLEHTGADGGPIQQQHSYNLAKLSDEEFEELMTTLRKARS